MTAATPGRELLAKLDEIAQFAEANSSVGSDRETWAVHARKVREVAVAIRLAAKPADEGWQDISNAPKDGTRILATGGGLGNEIEIVNYNERVGCWDAPNDTLDDRDDEPQGYNRPTLWQPLESLLSPSGTGAADNEQVFVDICDEKR